MITVDPTQISKIEIKSIKSYKNKFINKPLSWETRNIKIYKPFDYKDNNINFSTNPMFGNALNFDYIKSVSIFDIIKNIKYNNKYPLLIKMDIEGIADLIITKLLEKRIFPNFIVFELERSTSIFDQINFFKKLIKLNTLLKKNYDTYYFTKQKIGYRLELISVKKRNIKFI
jgi:hypothetical protein